MSLRLAIAMAVMAALGASYGLGRHDGGKIAEARHSAAQRALERRLAAAVEAAREKETQRLAAMAAIAELERELSDAASADPDAGRVSIGASGVFRLNAIR